MKSVWHPLTDEERWAEIRDAHACDPDAMSLTRALRFPVRDPGNRDQVLRNLAHHDLLTPVLPPIVSRCRTCLAPTVRPCGRCRSCELLGPCLRSAVTTLEMLCVSGLDRSPHRQISAWVDGDRGADGDEWVLSRVGAALSAYTEHRRERLLDHDTVVTCVSTRAQLIADAFEYAAASGWYALTVQPSGEKSGDWSNRDRNQADRLARRATDWRVNRNTVTGRRVLLFDDMMVTGGTVFSYASALRAAGALEVRAVVFERCVRGPDYYDALRAVRLRERCDWSPSIGYATRP
jgi:hypothetical protein